MYKTKNMPVMLFAAAVVLLLTSGGFLQAAANTAPQDDPPELDLSTDLIDESFLAEAANADEAAQLTLAEFNATDDLERKKQLWLFYLKKYPEGAWVPRVLNYLAMTHYASEDGDYSAAINLVESRAAKIEDAGLLAEIDNLLLDLHGRQGNAEKIKELVGRITKSSDELDAAKHLSIAGAAGKAGATELAIHHAEQAIALASVEELRKTLPPNAQVSDSRLERQAERLKARGHLAIGEALLNAEEIDKALKAFENAAGHTTFNFVGVTTSDINKLWAKALFERGDFRAAMERIAPDAIMLGDEDALELFSDAYLMSGGTPDALEDVKKEWRTRLGKEVPNFTAYKYDESLTPITYEELKGKVTLLAFFFPT